MMTDEELLSSVISHVRFEERTLLKISSMLISIH